MSGSKDYDEGNSTTRRRIIRSREIDFKAGQEAEREKTIKIILSRMQLLKELQDKTKDRDEFWLYKGQLTELNIIFGDLKNKLKQKEEVKK